MVPFNLLYHNSDRQKWSDGVMGSRLDLVPVLRRAVLPSPTSFFQIHLLEVPTTGVTWGMFVLCGHCGHCNTSAATTYAHAVQV